MAQGKASRQAERFCWECKFNGLDDECTKGLDNPRADCAVFEFGFIEDEVKDEN